MALEKHEPNMAAMKATKEVKQKAKQACQEYIKRPAERNRCTENIHK